MGIGQHICRRLGISVVGRIDRTAVSTLEACETVDGDHVPVLHGGGIDVLVEDTFYSNGERESGREGIIDGERGLPYLRHLEVRIYRSEFFRNLAVCGGDLLREAEAVPLLPHLLAVGDQVTLELLKKRVRSCHTILVRSGDDTGILVHRRVRRHVGKEDERNVSSEETGTAADLEALVTEYIPGKTDTGGDNRSGSRPLAGIDVTDIALSIRIFKIVNSLVGDDVAVVEDVRIETDTGGELEAVGHVPVILDVSAGLVVDDTAGRIVTHEVLVAISEIDSLGGSSVEEVIEGVVTIVTRTVPEICVVSHLVLVGDTGHELVVAGVDGEVVLDIDDVVVVTVLPGEEFITERHVRSDGTGTVEDVDEREVGGRGAAGSVKLGIGGQELVHHVVGEPAVQVKREALGEIVRGVERVGEGHRVLRETGLGRTLSAIG